MATGLAACAHLVVLLLLGWKVPRLVVPSRSEDTSPTLELTLMRPERRPPAEPEPESRPAPAPPAASARALTRPAVQAPPANPPTPTIPAPVPPNVETNPQGDTLRNALRGLIGCSAMASRLTQEEREACGRRLASATPAPVGKSYSAEELAQFDRDKQESIFTRKPHDECLPRLGDHPRAAMPGGAPAPGGPRGRAASTAVGVGCAKSFWTPPGL